MRKIRVSKCPRWFGVLTVIVAPLIVGSTFWIAGDPVTRWPVWVGAGIFFLIGIQILRVSSFGANPHGRTSAILAAVAYAAFASLFALVASELFSGSGRVKAKHPLLAKIHIIFLLGIVGFLFARFVYRALFPSDDDNAA